MIKRGLPPIIDDRARILILGSLPGEQSLKLNRYYGNERNDFWRVLSAVYAVTVPSEYEQRVEFLKVKRVALWDVLKSAEREGSLDSAIRSPVPNNVASVLQAYPSLEKIGLNGTKAGALYRRHVVPQLKSRAEPLVTEVLPSTSPMKGRNVLSFDEKAARWKVFLTR